MNNPKKNFIYNLIYQILILIIPLITAPYLSRVVGADGVGTYSYTYSIVYYFMLLTLLGINNYGNRSIAKVRDDKRKLSKTFWSLYLFQLLMGVIMLIAYISYLYLFDVKYRNIAIIQTLFIISAMLDINWLFFGLEEFKKTITRSTFVKIGNVILIFLLVKTKNDLWKYTLIMSGMTCLSQLILWSFLRKRISFVKININDIIKHIKSNLILFIPVVAVSLYKMMDKIMLGFLTSVTEVGFYENSEKIVNIPMTLITALGTVMLPRASNMISKGKINEVNKYIDKSISFVMFLSFAMCFGLIGIGYNFAPFYFGKEFQKSGLLIMLLSITLPCLAFANVLRTQYLIPIEKDKIYIKSVSIGAITNLIMNFIFIPKFKSIGACMGTIIAEFMVMLYQAISLRKELAIKEYIIKIIPFFIKSLIMLICIYPFNYIKMNSLIRLILQVCIGGTIYLLLNIKYVLSIVNLKKIFNKALNKNKIMKKETIKNSFDKNFNPNKELINDNIFSIQNPKQYTEKEKYYMSNINQLNKDSISNLIRKDNSYIKNIDFNIKYDFDIVDLMINEAKIYNFKFNNDYFLREGKYPSILCENHQFVKYVIDKDFNNIFYINTRNLDEVEIRQIINYTFRKIYLLQKSDSNITFNKLNKFCNNDIINNSYFKECLKYIKK